MKVSIGFSHSHLVLPVPLQLAPSFSTPVCCVSYYLHFQFVTTPTPATKQVNNNIQDGKTCFM